MTRQRPVDLPRWAYVPALVGVAFVLLPLVAIVAKVDWPNFLDLITSEDSRAALALSLRTSVASTVACIVLGVPLALVLARWDFRYLGLLRSLVLLPLVLPPVVGGLALLYTFGRRGLLGESLEALGVQIAFSTIAVVMAQTFVALPVPGRQPRGRAAHRRRPVRGRGRLARRLADHGVPPDHPAVGHARPHLGRGAGVRPRAG